MLQASGGNFTEINISIGIGLGLIRRSRLSIFEAEKLLQKVKSILIDVKPEGKNLGLHGGERE
jgi:hypothetical protein